MKKSNILRKNALTYIENIDGLKVNLDNNRYEIGHIITLFKTIKLLGWSLREYSKINPKWVRDFINKYQFQMDKLSIKEASKYI